MRAQKNSRRCFFSLRNLIEVVSKLRKLASAWSSFPTRPTLCDVTGENRQEQLSLFPYKPARRGEDPALFLGPSAVIDQTLLVLPWLLLHPVTYLLMMVLETLDPFLSSVRSSLTHIRDSVTHGPSLAASAGHSVVRSDQSAAFLSTLGIQNCSSETSEVCSTKRTSGCSEFKENICGIQEEMELKELNNLEKLISLHM